MRDRKRARPAPPARRPRHSVVARLAQMATTAGELGPLMEAAVRQASTALESERGAVWTSRSGEEELVMCAGVGWSKDPAGPHVAPASVAAAARLVLEESRPVIVRDGRRARPLPPLPALLEHGIASTMAVIIGGEHRPWGVLGVYSGRRRVYTTEDLAFLQSVANVLALAVARHERELARRRAEVALTESEARFARIFQASPVALGMSTVADGRIIDVNQSWLEMFGYRRHEVIGRTNAELGITIDPRSRAATVERVREEGIVRNLEVKVRGKAGEVRDILASAVPIALAGEEEAWISACTDITERKRAEAERDRLLESERAARAEAEAALERLRAIESITDAALGHLGLDEQLRELLARLRRALGTDSASVLLLDEDGQSLYARAVDGFVHERAACVRVPVGRGVTGRIAAEGRPLIVTDYSTVDVSWIEGMTPSEVWARVKSIMGVPLRIGERVVGVVVVNSSTPRRFTEEELHLLGLVADRVAPAIELGRLVERVRDGRVRQKVLARRLLTAQEEERRRLAVELHDELGQVLTAVKIDLASQERLSAMAPAPAHLRAAIDSVDRAMERVRDLALALRPSVLDDLGLPAALRWYADRFARDAGIEAHLSIDAVPRLEPELETACFRVAQEALTNVARHARARRIWLDLRLHAGRLELIVRDDGIGFDAPAARERAAGGASMGLLGMQERVTLVGGEYEVRGLPEGGTEVRARLPVSEKIRGSP